MKAQASAGHQARTARNSNASRGQASAELLIMVAIMAVFILPLLLITYVNASNSGGKATIAEAGRAGSQLASTADSVGYLGSGSSMFADIEMPQNVQGIEIRNSAPISEIVFNISTSSGTNQIVYVSHFPLSASTEDLQRIATNGQHRVNISAGNFEAGKARPAVTLKLN